MSITRDNHYVPIWYQRGFLEPGSSQLAYRDLQPAVHSRSDGTTRNGQSRFKSSPKRCFVQRDLYTTFFGSSVDDEIERRLFGAIDTDGALAIRAFIGDDVSAWHHHFQTLFRFIDVQKLRTPKGLDWLKTRYPRLSQNELMMEMQGIQAMHCTIWSEGVREIVSAADSAVKFIISDHPVTIYNYAAPPEADMCLYPHDPSIALKSSQTIYPLDRNHCLILTNLEYAKNCEVPPLEKRIFARNFRTSMVRTDAFARTRRFTTDEVRQINHIVKARAWRFVAAGREEWLDPEAGDPMPWTSLRSVLRPPEDALWHFGGEMYARFDDGHVHYQDAFGRTEKETDFLRKPLRALSPGAEEPCGCGSGVAFAACCDPLPVRLRPSWTERGIRERNLMLHRGVVDILGLNDGRDWLTVRRELSDEKIRDVHVLYRALWPLETDILQLLPKPDGRTRTVYTGVLHPAAVMEFALGSALYFGEVIIEHPFLHAANMQAEFSPIENPRAYHQDFIKTVFLFLTLMPLVAAGYVNLVPDPTVFDPHLHKQMLHMARARSVGMQTSLDKEPRCERIIEQDFSRNLMSLPAEGLKSQLRKSSPELNDAGLDAMVQGIRLLRESDPLAAVQDGLFAGGKKSGQMNMVRMAPNFEMALYLAQATGSSIVTDSPHRWREIMMAVARQGRGGPLALPELAKAIAATPFGFANEVEDFDLDSTASTFAGYPPLFGQVFNYLVQMDVRGRKPNWERHIASRFTSVHARAQKRLQTGNLPFGLGNLQAIFPDGGIRDNTVNRLLLMSSSEHHLPSVPMAFLIEPVT
jgi:hypothetical protein